MNATLALLRGTPEGQLLRIFVGSLPFDYAFDDLKEIPLKGHAVLCLVLLVQYRKSLLQYFRMQLSQLHECLNEELMH